MIRRIQKSELQKTQFEIEDHRSCRYVHAAIGEEFFHLVHYFVNCGLFVSGSRHDVLVVG